MNKRNTNDVGNLCSQIGYGAHPVTYLSGRGKEGLGVVFTLLLKISVVSNAKVMLC